MGTDNKGRREKRLRVRGVRRNPPDLRMLAGALIDLARAQAEIDAEVDHARRQAAADRRDKRDRSTRGDAA